MTSAFTALLMWSTVLHAVLAENPYFWHITDFHWDPQYDNWADHMWTSCNENVSQTQGIMGDFECDAPWELVKSSVLAMQRNGRDPAFVLWTGDCPPHPNDRTWLDQDMVLQIIDNSTQLIKGAFDPAIPVVVSMGNHDFFPVNQLPASNHEIYDAVYEMWKPWLTRDSTNAKETFTKAAYYTMTLNLDPVIRVIVVNTNLYYTSNKAVDGPDPGDQFQWLEDLLTEARSNGEKVHLIVHIPPGVLEVDTVARWFKADYNTRFNGIVRTYGDAILGIYSCHEHIDSFKLFYDSDGKPVASMLIAPSVTPWRARIGPVRRGDPHNPGVRKVYFDKETFQLVDFEQYYLDLDKYKDSNLQDAEWTMLYRFTDAYGVKNISTPELHSLAEEFREYGSEKFHKYFEHNSVMAGPVTCSCSCKNDHICAVQNVDFDAFDKCSDEATCGTGGVQYSVSILATTSLMMVLLNTLM